MTYEIVTFGNGEILKGVFDSIAMCLNGKTGILFEPLKRLGLMLGVFWAALYALYQDQIKVFTHWVVPMAAIMNLLFVPTTSVWIHDPVTKYHQKVDNVPYGLAAFAGYVSKIGYLITEQIESVFSLPDDLKYQKSGSLFASNLIQKAKTFHITNEDLAENMRSFVGQCVIYTAMMGQKYTLEDLRHSEDLWKLISDNASPVRSFMWRDLRADGQPRNRPQIISCKEGVDKFNAHWDAEMDRAYTIYGKKIFGKNSLVSAKAELLKYLPLSYNTLSNLSQQANDILKQQMMMYALIDGVESQSTALGNAPNFAVRKAHLQQRATYETLGAMAGDTLVTMKAVLEAIAYACFLFVIPMSLLPFGYRFLLSWAQILLWLQMWAPLYAILNYIMTMSAKSKALGILASSSVSGVTIASSVGLTQMNADMAGYLAMSIPFLCIALVKGVGSFVHMASHLGNVSQSAAGSAASEVTSGNFSYGNVSEGNMQITNTSMLSHSMAANYKSGSFHLSDGRSEVTTMADGSHIAHIGTSKLPTNVRLGEMMSASQREASSISHRRGMNLSESSSKSFGDSLRAAVALSDTLSNMESSGQTSNHGITTEQSMAIHRGKNLVEDFAKQYNISSQKSAEVLAEASVGLGVGKNSFSSSFKGNINAQDQELYQKAQKYAEDHQLQEIVRESAQAAQSLSHTATNEKAKRLAQDLAGSYEEGVQQRSEAQKSFAESNDYSRQAGVSQSKSASIDSNHAQAFFEYVVNSPADNATGIMGHQAAVAVLSRPHTAEMYARRYIEDKGLVAQSLAEEGDPPRVSSLRQAYEEDTRHQSYAVIPDSRDIVRRQAENMDLRGVNTSVVPQVQQEQHNHKAEINKEDHALQEAARPVVKDIQEQREKGVSRRVMERGWKEGRETAEDVLTSLSKLNALSGSYGDVERFMPETHGAQAAISSQEVQGERQQFSDLQSSLPGYQKQQNKPKRRQRLSGDLSKKEEPVPLNGEPQQK